MKVILDYLMKGGTLYGEEGEIRKATGKGGAEGETWKAADEGEVESETESQARGPSAVQVRDYR